MLSIDSACNISVVLLSKKGFEYYMNEKRLLVTHIQTNKRTNMQKAKLIGTTVPNPLKTKKIYYNFNKFIKTCNIIYNSILDHRSRIRSFILNMIIVLFFLNRSVVSSKNIKIFNYFKWFQV